MSQAYLSEQTVVTWLADPRDSSEELEDLFLNSASEMVYLCQRENQQSLTPGNQWGRGGRRAAQLVGWRGGDSLPMRSSVALQRCTKGRWQWQMQEANWGLCSLARGLIPALCLCCL